MSHNPTTPEPVPESALEDVYSGRWTIELEHTLGVWSAVRRSGDGRHIRCIIGRSRSELLTKLQTADVVEP
jgi:hypothetical protein